MTINRNMSHIMGGIMKQVALIGLYLVFTSNILNAESLLDHKLILDRYFENYFSFDRERETERIQEFEKTTYSINEYQEYQKKNKDYLVTKNHLEAKGSGYSSVEKNDKRNLKRIEYSITSSLYLKDYNPANIFDGSLSTAWVVNTKSSGKGEWIRLNITNHYQLNEKMYHKPYRSILIFPGYGKSDELFYQNNRIKSVLIFVAVSDSSYKGSEAGREVDKMHEEPKKVVFCRRFCFNDEPKYHAFLLPEYPSLNGTQYSFTLFIESVYKGSKYNDTCISEVQLLW